jgi:hypothetical protein
MGLYIRYRKLYFIHHTVNSEAVLPLLVKGGNDCKHYGIYRYIIAVVVDGEVIWVFPVEIDHVKFSYDERCIDSPLSLHIYWNVLRL